MCTRLPRKGVGFAGWALTIGGIALVAVAAVIVANRWSTGARGSLATAQSVAMLGLTALIVLTPGIFLRRLSRERHDFFSGGVAFLRDGKIVRTLAYRDAVWMQFATGRQYVHGKYAGSTVSLKLMGPEKTAITYRGKYDERVIGSRMLGLKKEFASDDPINAVRDVIAKAIAHRWAAALGRGESVDWCGGVRFTPEGLVCKHGRRRNQVIPYRAVTRIGDKSTAFMIYADEEPKPFVTLLAGARNFWPGLVLLTMLSTASPQSAEPADSSDEDSSDDD